MSPVGFEPTISAGERPQTYAFDRLAAGSAPSHCHIYIGVGVPQWLSLRGFIPPVCGAQNAAQF